MSVPGPCWIDRTAHDRSGQVLGVVVDVYNDPRSQTPAWLAISTGFFGARTVIAPIAGVSSLGTDVVIAHDRADIDTAPSVNVHVVVSEADDQRLTEHFSACARSRQHTQQTHKGITSS